MEDHPPVHVTGKELRSISNMSSDISNDVAEGVIRVFNADVASKLKHDTSFAPRCYVTIAFMVCASIIFPFILYVCLHEK